MPYQLLTSFKVNGIDMSDFVYPASLRGLSKTEVGEVRSPQQSDEAVSNPEGRLSDHFQKWQ